METVVGNLVQKTKAIYQEVGDEVLDPKEKLCSFNHKTGWSINFPIWRTCRPTAVCAKLCYGALPGKPITWDASIKKFLRVYEYFLEENPDVIADRIAVEYYKRGMTFIRWNGVGDLFQQSVDVINIICQKYPDIVQWVVTRIPEMAVQLDREAENLYVMFSLDDTDESRKRKTIVETFKHPRIYYSFLREQMDQDTMGARIVFNTQQIKKELYFDNPKTCCPVDAGVIPVEGACEGCRKCFSNRTFQ